MRLDWRHWTMTALLMVATVVEAESIAVVVHPSSRVQSLTRDDVMRLYMGKIKTFPNGSPATPVYQKEGSPLRIHFDSLVLNRQPAQVKAYWAQQIFTGRGTPPEEEATDGAVLQRVAAVQHAIGFVSAASADKSVKVVLTLP